jgi:hypothetical protein
VSLPECTWQVPVCVCVCVCVLLMLEHSSVSLSSCDWLCGTIRVGHSCRLGTPTHIPMSFGRSPFVAGVSSVTSTETIVGRTFWLSKQQAQH